MPAVFAISLATRSAQGATAWESSVTHAFPCQDLSQAGRTRGIDGHQSGLVGEVFRLVDGLCRSDSWLLLENVPFMLQLDRGRGMRFLTESLEPG
jgi:DNA (cytosine-5)-methyltransferase 1